jgi:hypothetical protein
MAKAADEEGMVGRRDAFAMTTVTMTAMRRAAPPA